MNINDLRHASDFAQLYGAKCIVFGPPGKGKTPIINTAPRPVLLATEPGLLSMRGSTVPTWVAGTTKAIDEFFDWWFGSNDSRNFDTLCIDSGSQTAETLLFEKQGTVKDGRKLYGELLTHFQKHFERVYQQRYKHVYMTAKMHTENGLKRPYFPGQALNIWAPHRYDIIMCLDDYQMPDGKFYRMFKTRGTFDILARDRSGKLNEFEGCDLAALFNKVMS